VRDSALCCPFEVRGCVRFCQCIQKGCPLFGVGKRGATDARSVEVRCGGVGPRGNQGENNMERRKLLIGMGSLAAGSGAVVGSGAITSFSGNRDATVPLANDANGMIGIQSTEHPNGQYLNVNGGQVAFEFGDDADAAGFNEGQTYIDHLFKITNQSLTPQFVWIEEDGNKGRDKATGFYVGTGPSDGSPPDYQISIGSENVKPRDLQPLKPYNDDPVPAEGTHAAPLCPGDSVDVGFVVDTRQIGSPSTPAQLLNKVTIHSVSDRDDLPARDNGNSDLDPGSIECVDEET
jgi:hypothetical protein